ncbi:hypothetical protein [Halorientalis pallida]|uniref:Uncharacterized protein n=1 Tax=Halorientalis pallida TaxID=2479928 RepID=A0A498L0S2_9EURY|nr:hypothetical protein [Halorientalis pallida]RXK46996.1 hypothetical protein EAF64_17805 [Halorientalis pallida]
MSEPSRRWVLGAAGIALTTTGCIGTTPDENTPSPENSEEIADTSGQTPTPVESEEITTPQADPTPEPETTTSEPEPRALRITKEIARIHGYRWRAHRFVLKRRATFAYKFTIREGPKVDAYLLSKSDNLFDSEWDNFKTRNKFQPLTADEGVRDGKDSINLEAGTYVFVVDNTNRGPTTVSRDVGEHVAVAEIHAAYKPFR